jgi:NhaP-type Na+/H+ or K+/H+ antiporter
VSITVLAVGLVLFVNDGTGLLALQFGLLMLVTGRTPSFIEGIGRLVFLTAGGVLVGLAIGGRGGLVREMG